MSDARSALEEVARALLADGLEDVELYLKRGRSRRAALGSQGRLASVHRERGWAVRASGTRSSLFCCGSGIPPAAGPWPLADGAPIRLPGPRPASDWREPGEQRLPLCVEHEALEILEACEHELAGELPAARLLQATLEDGESESTVVNTRGVEATWRQRTATLYLEAALGDDEVFEYSGGSSARAFHPKALARRIADRLLIRRDGLPGERDRGPVLLAPPVAVRILGALLPIWMGAKSPPAAAPGGAVGSKRLTIIDDGRLSGGLLAAPVDGEGSPTRRTILVERGVLRATLGLPSPAGADSAPRSTGHVRRASYRDVPCPGPSHLFIDADRAQSPAALLGDLARAHYFLDAIDAGRFDIGTDQFEIEVAGFEVRRGRATKAVAGARLSGKISQLLGGLEAVARDLTFFPLAGLLGSPSLLISGLDVNR